MNDKKTVREPKQKRSTETCDRIRKAALELFCKNGYYQTTTNAIAKVAGVPIGSLYSYFADKDAIFLAILADYNAMFVGANQDVLERDDLYRADKKAWLRALIENLVNMHENSRDLNREIKILSFSRPDVAAFRAKNDEVTRKLTYDFFLRSAADLHLVDIESASIVAYTFISAVVDYLVFENPQADRKRIIDTAVEGLYRALGVQPSCQAECVP
jgi:AcrR family transcriptional regulator